MDSRFSFCYLHICWRRLRKRDEFTMLLLLLRTEICHRICVVKSTCTQSFIATLQMSEILIARKCISGTKNVVATDILRFWWKTYIPSRTMWALSSKDSSTTRNAVSQTQYGTCKTQSIAAGMTSLRFLYSHVWIYGCNMLWACVLCYYGLYIE